MESKRRELLKKITILFGFLASFKLLPGCQSNNKQLSSSNSSELDSYTDITQDFYLPKNPEIYQVVNGIRVKRLFIGNTPKIYGNGHLIYGIVDSIQSKRGEVYSFQYLGPYLGWNVI